MLMNRDDIKGLDEYLKQFRTFSQLSPEMISLYDKIINLQRIQELSEETRKSFLERLFSTIAKHCDVDACMEIIPSLINEWYNLNVIKNLSIRKDNKDIIKPFLDNIEVISILKERKMDEEHICKKLGDISKSINNDNFKYLEDCLRLNIDEKYLSYFDKDTKDIISKYLSWYENIWQVLDRIHRRWHTLQSISNIFGDEPITPLTERLLEFKEFDKFKYIWFDEYKNLSIEDKKLFLNGFISALTPYDVLYPNDSRWKENFKYLQDKMKIFGEINWENGVEPSWSDANIEIRERRLKEYYHAILKVLLDWIPDDERVAAAYKWLLNIHYRKEYREKNKIPPLVDDIEKVLNIRIENVKWRKVKVAELDYDTDYWVSAHRFNSISSIEALEITDPQMFLAVWTNWWNWTKVNVYENWYALLVKPRNIWNMYVESYGDIDSWTWCMKNLYNFENIQLPTIWNLWECISLVPTAIKKELNLSQEEYTKRIDALWNVTTLQEVWEKDKELELGIRSVLKKVGMYEWLITPTIMWIAIWERKLDEVDDDILDYCVRRDIPLVKIKYQKNGQESNVDMNSWSNLEI